MRWTWIMAIGVVLSLSAPTLAQFEAGARFYEDYVNGNSGQNWYFDGDTLKASFDYWAQTAQGMPNLSFKVKLWVEDVNGNTIATTETDFTLIGGQYQGGTTSLTITAGASEWGDETEYNFYCDILYYAGGTWISEDEDDCYFYEYPVP